MDHLVSISLLFKVFIIIVFVIITFIIVISITLLSVYLMGYLHVSETIVGLAQSGEGN
jgi:hypothetical protein